MHYHGIDLLKIISMIFIMALHVMGHGGILRTAEGINYYIVWLLEILCYCSVNCYAIISGFLGYGKQRRLSRYIVLWLQVVFFGIFIWGIAAVVKPELVGINDVVKLILPVTFDQYWYFTAYSVLFLIMPMLNIFVDKLTEKEGRKVLLSCFLVFSCYGVLNFKYSDSLHLLKGYSSIWLAVLYVVGALFKKFQWTFQTKKVLGVLVICWLGGWFWRVKISGMLGNGAEKLVLNYVSPVMFVMAICFFVLFLNIGKESKMIKAISASTFGAYLFQEQYIFRDNFLKKRYTYIAGYELLHMVAAIVVLAVLYFVVGILIDKVRMGLFKFFKVHDFSVKIENLIASVYIPFQVNHLHGNSEPPSRMNRATFTEGEPFI